MITHYQVIQYLPDPVTGEIINIGVIVYDDRRVLVRFLSDWERVRVFAGQGITFLFDFVHEMESRSLNADTIKRLQGWGNSIQVTAPRSSMVEDLPTLLLSTCATFLHEKRQSVV